VTTTAPNIRPAASLLMLRDGPRGVEVLMMRRPERGDNDFRSGACVFPGGVLDAADTQARRWCLGLDDATASARLGLDEGGLDWFIAAMRESFEEVGLLFVCRADGALPELTGHAAALRDWRTRMHRGEATLAQLCEAFDWRIDLRDTAFFAHWLTPVVRPKRFDTRFFVRLAPAGQQATPDLGEALELLWLTPDELLDAKRGLKLLNVTQKVLHSVHGLTSARAGYEQALARRGVKRIFPRPVRGPNGMQFVIDSDPAYAEVARLDPDGNGQLHSECLPGDVLQLSQRLWRVGGMRRNAYVVADGAGGDCALIDADADDPQQLRALAGLPLGAVRHLLFSEESSADALRRLRETFPQAQVATAPPDGLRVGAQATLRGLRSTGAAGLCWRLDEDAMLLGGDSVTLLATAQGTPGIEWLAPTRGFLVLCGGG
jgi:8-oxo-dGTP pyrophosphatase MutT (NUDIX family)